MATVMYGIDEEGQELADVDVSTLTQKEAHDLRLDLRHQLFEDTYLAPDVREFYEAKIREIVAAFPIG